MAEFAKYYLEFIWELGRNFILFFAIIFDAIGSIFSRDIPGYFFKLNEAIKSFDVLGWLTLLIVTVFNVLLVFFVGYRTFLALRKYVFVRRKEIEKEELLEEIAKLKETTEQLAIEKNQIFALKLNELTPYAAVSGGLPGATKKDGEEEEAAETATENSRFSKLIAIDERYKFGNAYIIMSDQDMIPLSEIVIKFTYFAASRLKLYYKPQIIRFFFAGLATSKIMIIEGISGTGKTSLPYAMAKFFDNDASLISVQPSWRDRGELLGYLNEFTKKFNETDFLASLYEATYRDDINFIVLDEMNLARIEYYFAEFLSIMEMPDKSEWKIDLVPVTEPADPKNVIEGKLTVPQNVWFIGTANQDDSTFTITDKVYDRAVAIALNEKGTYFDAPVTDTLNMSVSYLESLFGKAFSEYYISPKSIEKIAKLDEFVQAKFRVAFGNRILKQMNLFTPVIMAAGGSENEGIDFIMATKIFKKFNSLNLVFLSKELTDLIALIEKLFGKDQLPLSVAFLKQLQKNI